MLQAGKSPRRLYGTENSKGPKMRHSRFGDALILKSWSKVRLVGGMAILLMATSTMYAQPLLIPGQNNVNVFGDGNNAGRQNRNQNGNANGQGGAAQADFDTLIDLIKETIQPDEWDDVGGNGTIQGFPGGVYVDASGVMKRISPQTRSLLAKHMRRIRQPGGSADTTDLAKSSELRMVSLRRLDQQLQACAVREEPPTEAMRYLAGLERIDYLVFDHPNNDVILVGPADRWIRADDGRIVSYSTRRPVLQLDDLVVLLRNSLDSHGKFTCSITPTQKGLANLNEYVERTTQQPLKPGTRDQWVAGLQDSLGNQMIEIAGLAPNTRVGRVIVEADYHMKLVGIGLEPGPDGVVSYLDSIEVAKGQDPPPMSVLRWWFTLKSNQLNASPDGSTIDLTQPAIQLLSENQLLTNLGRRIRTGQSDELNARFASSFTTHFDALSDRYPVYADLENVFELAIVASLVRQELKTEKLVWKMPFLMDPDKYKVETARVAREVPSIVNHRFINGKHVVCAVSGGVRFGRDVTAAEDDSLQIPSSIRSQPTGEANSWWWD